MNIMISTTKIREYAEERKRKRHSLEEPRKKKERVKEPWRLPTLSKDLHSLLGDQDIVKMVTVRS